MTEQWFDQTRFAPSLTCQEPLQRERWRRLLVIGLLAASCAARPDLALANEAYSKPLPGLNVEATVSMAEAAERHGRSPEALRFYLMAARAGHGPSQLHVANLYGGDAGVPRDYAKAVYWQRRARESGEQVEQIDTYGAVGSLR